MKNTVNRQYYVYIMASEKNGTLYTGFTSDLIKRVYEHKHNLKGKFTQKYFVHILVYYEIYTDSYSAICREKVVKRWKRAWRIALVNKENEDWRDLYKELL